ncbi:hypothetical protein GMD78_05265 [Ornithinibacillus sp. L9]|uniref:Lipoprotein n=1 Tax=Ornithinibacillus caprae TaxID=2678566 RepID=A0A6N8FE57_9BACI|nr:hypothetical protein [Ornithinibacillus caprae]MUK87810.1 hypothetical protein [Ornithinibacillus caprae]
MNKLISFVVFVSFIFLIGCTNSIKYNDEDVAAIVRGEEITIGELRFLYQDQKLLDVIDGVVKAELAVQEAKKMNLDVSKEIKETIEARGGYPPDDIDNPTAKSIREFAEPQAKKLGMDPGEYYEKYIEITTTTVAYINAYVHEILGEPGDNVEEYDERANQLLNDLVEENEDEIEILIE